MGDLISRQDAIRLAEQGQIQGFEWQFKKLCELPSTQSERKKGKWIEYKATGKKQWMCSECCAEEKNPKVARFCYWCGADMRGDSDE